MKLDEAKTQELTKKLILLMKHENATTGEGISALVLTLTAAIGTISATEERLRMLSACVKSLMELVSSQFTEDFNENYKE